MQQLTQEATPGSMETHGYVRFGYCNLTHVSLGLYSKLASAEAHRRNLLSAVKPRRDPAPVPRGRTP
jgi:hypothetical protein